MKYLERFPYVIAAVLLAVAWSAALAAPLKPPAEPAKIEVSVSPDGVDRGGAAQVTVQLRPIEGVKINRYPQIKLEIPAHDGVHAEASATVGNDSPPPPELLATKNYFDEVDPIELEIWLDESAPVGELYVEGKLTYYYCVIESGFCAPKRTPLKIPLTVR